MRTDTGYAPAVDIIDAAGGNTGSVYRALERLGVAYNRVNQDNPPDGSRPIILPGVGSFGAVMSRLRQGDLDSRLVSLVKSGVPFLGICVGLQVLFEESEESPGITGLGLLPGQVRRFREGKVPQIGWNRVESTRPDLRGSYPDGYVYFVNSYFAEPTEPYEKEIVLYRGQYYRSFCAAVLKDNITAFQFHPEKSGRFGMSLISAWLDQFVPEVAL
ncbi:MAG: imidazole glycerol phosphate synthase subunit HisH [Candidatus Melainabacteria bacterium]|nr:imidazole glycerol phosphate synthase subunit HisH [Candidatus Melainabacteria bacterium]